MAAIVRATGSNLRTLRPINAFSPPSESYFLITMVEVMVLAVLMRRVILAKRSRIPFPMDKRNSIVGPQLAQFE